MDICNFINSKDIADYLRKLNYKFNTLEAAWLIYQCHRLTMEERHTTWKAMMEEMSDCEVPERMNCLHRSSLFELINDYIAIELKDWELFKVSSDKTVYTWSVLYSGCKDWEDHDGIYSSLDGCCSSIIESLEDEDFELVHIARQKIDNDTSFWNAEFDKTYKLLEICGCPHTDDEIEVLALSFEGMWFDFPTPFEKGDILIRYCKYPGLDNFPFILNDLITWDCPEHVRSNGDITDMCAGFIGVNEGEGTFYNERKAVYMDFEYYREPLKGEYRVLKPLSSLMKGEINETLAFNAFRRIMFEELAAESWMKEMFGEAAYINAGLK